MTARIRALREEAGWSQSDLAARAGVSRQLVSAVESGRHVPSVAAALALARALGRSVEELFADEPGTAVPVLTGMTLHGGAPVMVARVGDTPVAVPARHGVASAEQWELADATVTASGELAMLPGGTDDGLLVAGCDPALGVLAGLVERSTRHRVVTVHASTGRALDALSAGRVHGVVVHAPPGALPQPPVPVRRWHLARWQVGLASRRTTGVPPVEEIAERRLRVVQREDGATTQQAFARALQRIGAPTSVPGPVAEGHVDVARRVASGASAGLTMEPAARAFGLGFAALENHTVEVWIDERWADLPAASALIEALSGAAFRSRLGLVGGYDLSRCATRVA